MIKVSVRSTTKTVPTRQGISSMELLPALKGGHYVTSKYKEINHSKREPQSNKGSGREEKKEKVKRKVKEGGEDEEDRGKERK